MATSTTGKMLDDLGVELDLSDDQQLTDVVVLGRVIDFTDGKTGLVIGSSKNIDWIVQVGLLAAARQVIDAEPAFCEDDD